MHTRPFRLLNRILELIPLVTEFKFNFDVLCPSFKLDPYLEQKVRRREDELGLDFGEFLSVFLWRLGVPVSGRRAGRAATRSGLPFLFLFDAEDLVPERRRLSLEGHEVRRVRLFRFGARVLHDQALEQRSCFEWDKKKWRSFWVFVKYMEKSKQMQMDSFTISMGPSKHSRGRHSRRNHTEIFSWLTILERPSQAEREIRRTPDIRILKKEKLCTLKATLSLCWQYFIRFPRSKSPSLWQKWTKVKSPCFVSKSF